VKLRVWIHPFGRSERGASGLTLIAIVSVTLIAGMLVLTAARIVVAASHAQAVVDQAARDAADTLSGRFPGYACERAQRHAEESQNQLVSCDVAGLDARVTLRVTVGTWTGLVRAHAGPPPD
jgi:secretion/DNA translocation related TadE-like protein